MFCWNYFLEEKFAFYKISISFMGKFQFCQKFLIFLFGKGKKKIKVMAPRLLGWKAPVDFVVVCRERAKLTIVFQAGSWGDAAGLEEGGGEVECPGTLPALQPSCLPSSQARGKARRRRRTRRRRRGRRGVASLQQPADQAPAALPFRQAAGKPQEIPVCFPLKKKKKTLVFLASISPEKNKIK